MILVLNFVHGMDCECALHEHDVDSGFLRPCARLSLRVYMLPYRSYKIVIIIELHGMNGKRGVSVARRSALANRCYQIPNLVQPSALSME